VALVVVVMLPMMLLYRLSQPSRFVLKMLLMRQREVQPLLLVLQILHLVMSQQ
jgi:hypothetical protein